MTCQIWSTLRYSGTDRDPRSLIITVTLMWFGLVGFGARAYGLGAKQLLDSYFVY